MTEETNLNEVPRKRPPSDIALSKVPDAIKKVVSKDTVMQLASVIDEYIPKEPPMGEVTYAGPSRITGGSSAFNYYEKMGFYNSSDIPLNVLDAMRRDSQIALGMAAVKFPITSLGFTVSCKNPAIKKFIEMNFQNKWSHILRDMMMALDYGFTTFEKVWQTKRMSIDPGKNERKINNEKFIVLEKLKPIHPMTMKLRVDRLNNFVGVTQTGGARDVPLDRQKSMLFNYQEEYGNYFGKSRMVPAYEPWYWKIIATQFFLRWMERRSIPPIVVRYPQGVTIAKNGTQYSHVDLAFKLSQAFSSYGNITLPSKVDDKGNPLWKIDILDQGTQNMTLSEIVESVFNVAILRGMLVPDKKTFGALTPETVSQLFLSTVADLVCDAEETINRELVQPLVYWNFPKSEIVECVLNIEDIDFEKRQEARKVLMKFMDLTATFVKNTGGLPFENMPDLNRLLEILDMPATKAGIWKLPVYDTTGKLINEDEIIAQQQAKAKANAKRGPQKGEQTPGNLSKVGRDGEPRNTDQQDAGV